MPYRGRNSTSRCARPKNGWGPKPTFKVAIPPMLARSNRGTILTNSGTQLHVEFAPFAARVPRGCPRNDCTADSIIAPKPQLHC
eukprot:9496232-Pyramimonas_sp.AAC.1